MPSLPATSQRARVEIFRHLFASVAEEMGAVLRLSSCSPNIKERLDFSCALFDADGALLAQAMHIPVHLGAMSLGVRAALARQPGALEPGDVLITNDPFAGGTHLPDVTLISPIFHAEPGGRRRLVGYAANRAHHADLGGMTPGSMPRSTSVFQEGLRIPPVRLLRGGEECADVMALFLANVRGAEERRGDLRAQLAANGAGCRRLLHLVDRYGPDEILESHRALVAYSRRKMEQVIAAIPDGRYSCRQVLDDDGITSDPVPIQVTVEIDGSRARVDFAGSAPPSRGCVNATGAVTLACVHYVFHCLARGEVPANEGAGLPIQVDIPRSCVLAAEYPSAVVAGNVETSQRVVDALLGALAPALPDRIPAASSGTMSSVSLGGRRPGGAGEFSYYETVGGGMGGRPGSPGLSGIHTHMTNTRNTPVEALEFAYPLRVRRYSLRSGSGGRGARPGGEGLVRQIEALVECEGSLLTDRHTTRPYGLAGGEPGAPGRAEIRRASGEVERLPSKTPIHLQAGDVLSVETPGGGGHGSAPATG